MITHWRRAIRATYRWWSGDLAYETYLAHWRAHHAGEGKDPLSRRDFFREQTLLKWGRIQRCC